jgi:hypothetical protein
MVFDPEQEEPEERPSKLTLDDWVIAIATVLAAVAIVAMWTEKCF